MDDLTTTISCSSCHKHRVLNVSAYMNIQSIIRFEAKCSCGNIFETILERRKQFRKPTNLPGSYENCSEAKRKCSGLLTIRDISTNGMKLKTHDADDFFAGQVLRVQFYLDDYQRSFLSKSVVVKNQNDKYLGTELLPTENVCKALSYYLMN